MASKMAEFFQQLAIDADYQRRFEAGGDSRAALLQEYSFTAAECAAICAGDSNALHRQMMAELGDNQVQWNNNNTNQNISKFKRPDSRAQ